MANKQQRAVSDSDVSHDNEHSISTLFAPAHYYLDDVHCGSELSWSYGIVHGLGHSGTVWGDALTGYVVGSKDFGSVHVHELNPETPFEQGIGTTLKFLWRYFRAAQPLIKKHSYDVIHHILPFGIHQTFNLLALLGYTKGRRFLIGPVQVPLSFLSSDEQATNARKFKEHGSAFRYWSFAWATRLTRPILDVLSRKTLAKADAVIVINESARKLFESIVPRARIVVIPPGVDVQRYAYSPFSQKTKKKLYILSVGHLVKRKGVDLLLRGAAPVIREFPFIHLDIVGDGPQRGVLEELAKTLGIHDYVTFHGFVPNVDIAPYYAKAHLFASMSLSDSFGQMFIEAMASGLPVIASKTDGSQEIVENDKTGYLLEQGDVSSLTTILRAHAKKFQQNDYDDFERFSKAGRERVERVYAWPVVIRQYEELYRSLFVKS